MPSEPLTPQHSTARRTPCRQDTPPPPPHTHIDTSHLQLVRLSRLHLAAQLSIWSQLHSHAVGVSQQVAPNERACAWRRRGSGGGGGGKQGGLAAGRPRRGEGVQACAGVSSPPPRHPSPSPPRPPNTSSPADSRCLKRARSSCHCSSGGRDGGGGRAVCAHGVAGRRGAGREWAQHKLITRPHPQHPLAP